MKLWIARDKYNDAYGRGDVTLHLYKPTLNEYGRWRDKTIYGHICFLSKEDFPEVTFNNSPQEVELKLVNQANFRLMETLTKQQILDLLKSSKWNLNTESKLFIDKEFSESLSVWNDTYAFTIRGVRDIKSKENISLVVTQFRPLVRLDISFDKIEYILNIISMKYEFTEQLRKNEEEYNNFLGII